MIAEQSTCRIENTGSNTLILEEGIAYYEGKEIKLLDEAGVKWVYSSEIKPYQLYSFGQHILFQEGSEGKIHVLSREGKLKMIVPGRKMLDDQLRLPGRLLLTETRADEKLGLFELYEDFSVKERGYRMGSVNLRYHNGYLFHKFEGIRCWDDEKGTMVWEDEVVKFRQYKQLSTAYPGQVNELYFEGDIMVALFYKMGCRNGYSFRFGEVGA